MKTKLIALALFGATAATVAVVAPAVSGGSDCMLHGSGVQPSTPAIHSPPASRQALSPSTSQTSPMQQAKLCPSGWQAIPGVKSPRAP